MDSTAENQMSKIKFKDRHNWLMKTIHYSTIQVLLGRAKEIVSTDGLPSTFAVVGKYFVPNLEEFSICSYTVCLPVTGQAYIFISFLIMCYQ